MSFQLIFSASLFLSVILVLRKFLKRRVNNSFLLILWAVVFVKLMIPYSVPAPTSIYNLLPVEMYDSLNLFSEEDNILQPQEESAADFTADNEGSTNAVADNGANILMNFKPAADFIKSNLLMSVWVGGMICTFIFFGFVYKREISGIKTSLIPVRDSEMQNILQDFEIKRRVGIYCSHRVTSPVTFGVVHPKIVVPYDLDFDNISLVQHILTHELIHIKRFDMILKYMGLIALSVHWFNPLVWYAYQKMCVDIEMSCDENVLKYLGERKKKDYALSLVAMAERRQELRLNPITSFGSQPVKERVVNIMNYKKTKFITSLLCAVLMVSTVSVFATTATTAVSAAVNTKNTDMVIRYSVYGRDTTLNNNAAKEEKTTQEMGSEPEFNVHMAVLPARTYRHMVTYELKAGDIVEMSGFNVPKDESRIAIAINDELFTLNNGLCDIAYSIYSQLNQTYIAEEDGIYEIWAGNIGDTEYANLTGNIRIIRNKYTEEELDRNELLYKYNYYYNQLRNPDVEYTFGPVVRLSGYCELGGKDFMLNFYDEQVQAYTKVSFINMEEPRMYSDGYTYYEGLYREFLRDGYYTVSEIIVTDKAPEALIPKNGDHYEEIYRRIVLVYDNIFNDKYYLEEDDYWALRDDRIGEFNEDLKLAIMKEFNLDNLVGVEVNFGANR